MACFSVKGGARSCREGTGRAQLWREDGHSSDILGVVSLAVGAAGAKGRAAWHPRAVLEWRWRGVAPVASCEGFEETDETAEGDRWWVPAVQAGGARRRRAKASPARPAGRARCCYGCEGRCPEGLGSAENTGSSWSAPLSWWVGHFGKRLPDPPGHRGMGWEWAALLPTSHLTVALEGRLFPSSWFGARSHMTCDTRVAYTAASLLVPTLPGHRPQVDLQIITACDPHTCV